MAHAKEAQRPILQRLRELGVRAVRPFWITNFVEVSATQSIAHEIAKHPAVVRLEPNEHVRRLPVLSGLHDEDESTQNLSSPLFKTSSDALLMEEDPTDASSPRKVRKTIPPSSCFPLMLAAEPYFKPSH